jgi:hypothetical protein
MGLDMYLTGKKFIIYRTLQERTLQEDGFPLTCKYFELGYWRKHPNLHGYIVQTFAGGIDKCQDIDLTAPSLIRTIIAALKARRLPYTEGFFFGVSDASPERMAEDIRIFESALAWCQTAEPGVIRTLTYRASW